MLGVFAEFETNLRRERQLEGIAKAKAAGVYKGRPASIGVTKVREMKAQGMGASEIVTTSAPRRRSSRLSHGATCYHASMSLFDPVSFGPGPGEHVIVVPVAARPRRWYRP
jgi:hypothetical protein